MFRNRTHILFLLQNIVFVMTACMGVLSSEAIAATAVDEIVVTARLRAESIQDIGASVSAVTGEMIEKEGLTDFEDIARRTVSLELLDRGPNQNDPTIRGISNQNPAVIAELGNSGPLVSQFLDDIPTAASTSVQRDFNYFDFDRVEVLRGPQPTIFGEGSMGGTIRYFTKSPDLSQEGISDAILKARVSSTKDGGTNYSVSVAATATIVPDKLGIRGVINYRDDDGFIDNIVTGVDDGNTYESLSGRAVVLFTPTENFSARFMAFVGEDDIGETNSVDFTRDPEDLVSVLAVEADDKDDFELYTAKLDYEFDSLTITSITGLFKRDRFQIGTDPTLNIGINGIFLALDGFDLLLDGNGAVLGPPFTGILFERELLTEDKSFTQELRFVSDFDGPLNFVGGVYYQDTELDVDLVIAGNDISPFYFGQMENRVNDKLTRYESEQWSAFAEATWDITDSFRLIGGVRYVDEEITVDTIRNLNIAGGGATGLAPPLVLGDFVTILNAFGFPRESEFQLDQWLPRVAVEYDVNDDVMVYASYAKGVRNGNLNEATAAFQAENLGGSFAETIFFDQDSIKSYEVGVNSTWMEGDLRLNGAIYYMDYEDPQLNFTNPWFAVANGPDEEIWGAELEAVLAATDHLDLYLNVAYQDAEFTSDALLNVGAIVPIDLPAGNRPTNAPEWGLSAGADLNYPLANGLNLTGNLTYQFVDERFTTPQNFVSSKIESQQFVNVRFGLAGEHWAATAFVDNATNELEFQHRLGIDSFQTIVDGQLDYTQTDAFVNRPRTYGIELTLTY